MEEEQKEQTDPLGHYATLNLEPGASVQEVRKAYTKLSKTIHPDKVDQEYKETAEENFQKITDAYHVLSDPVKKIAYTKYGKGALVALEGVDIEWDNEDEIEPKIEKMMNKKYKKATLNDIHPRTNVHIGLSCAEYVDSLGYPRQGNMPLLMMTSFQLHELIKLNFNNRFTGDLGFVTHTKGGAGLSCILGRIQWAFGSGFGATLQVQGGDNWTQTLAIQKQIDNMSSVSAQTIISDGFEQVIQYNRKLTENFESTWEINIGQRLSSKASFNYDSGKNRYRGKVKTGAENSVGFGYTRQITDNFSFIADASVESDEGLSVPCEFGFKAKLTKHVRLNYTVQFVDDVRLKIAVSKGNFVLNIPISISEFLSKKSLAISVGLLGFISHLTYNLFLGKSKDAKKNKDEEKEREEGKRNAKDVSRMVRAKAIAVTERETAISGLVIKEAYYGDPDAIAARVRGEKVESKIVNVRKPLQILVENSQLKLTSGDKSRIPGFYNPCEEGTEPQLWIGYEYGKVYRIKVAKNTDSFVIPH